MSFISDLFRWFFTGSKAAPCASKTTLAPVHETVPAQAPERKTDDFDIFKGRVPMNFLDELRSIEPGSKALEQARLDMVRELKKLGTFN